MVKTRFYDPDLRVVGTADVLEPDASVQERVIEFVTGRSDWGRENRTHTIDPKLLIRANFCCKIILFTSECRFQNAHHSLHAFTNEKTRTSQSV